MFSHESKVSSSQEDENLPLVMMENLGKARLLNKTNEAFIAAYFQSASEILAWLTEQKQHFQYYYGHRSFIVTMEYFSHYIEKVSRAFEKLKDAGILNDQVQEAVVKGLPYGEDYAYWLIEFHLRGDEKSKALLTKYPEVIHGLVKLSRECILNDVNRDDIARNPEHAESISIGLSMLNRRNALNSKNRALIAKYPAHAHKMSLAFIRSYHKVIKDADNKALIDLDSKNAWDVCCGLVSLWEKGILNDKTRALIAQHPQHAKPIAQGLVKLHVYDEKLLDDTSIAFINQKPAAAEIISDWFIALHEKGIVDSESRAFVLTYPQLVKENTINQLVRLCKRNMLDDENTKLIDEYHQHVPSIFSALVQLNDEGIWDEQSKTIMLMGFEDGENHSNQLIALHQAGILNHANKALIIKHPEILEEFKLLFKTTCLTEAQKKYLAEDQPYAFEFILVLGILSERRMVKECWDDLVKCRLYSMEILNLLKDPRNRKKLTPHRFKEIIKEAEALIEKQKDAFLSAAESEVSMRRFSDNGGKVLSNHLIFNFLPPSRTAVVDMLLKATSQEQETNKPTDQQKTPNQRK